nr:MAG TPA: hypothetical protein [Caudoviricetes sp.]
MFSFISIISQLLQHHFQNLKCLDLLLHFHP